jgi:hypothetical protein
MKTGVTIERTSDHEVSLSLTGPADRGVAPAARWTGHGAMHLDLPYAAEVATVNIRSMVRAYRAMDIICAGDLAEGARYEEDRAAWRAARDQGDGALMAKPEAAMIASFRRHVDISAAVVEGMELRGEPLYRGCPYMGTEWMVASYFHEEDHESGHVRLHIHNVVLEIREQEWPELIANGLLPGRRAAVG